MVAKKIYAILLVLIIVLSFAACGEDDTTTAATTATTAATTAADSTTEATDEGPQMNENGEFDVQLPCSDEVVTITMWGGTPDSSAGMNSQNDSVARQELEKRTNVHIEWTHPVTGQETAQFNLMIASEQYTDAIIGNSGYYIGGFDKFINDGILVDLAPYTEYMQNYMKARSVDLDTLLNTTTDAGYIAFWDRLKINEQGAFMGPLIRKDITDEIGIDLSSVVTYDDWYEMLTSLVNAGYSNPATLYISSGTGNGLDTYMMAGMNMNTRLYAIDGEIRYSANQPEFKDYITLMNKWYTENLIDKDFYSRKSSDYESLFLNGDLIVGPIMYINYDRYNMQTVDDGKWAAIEVPLESADMERHIGAGTNPVHAVNTTTSITTSMDESLIPVFCQYQDYLYTEEGTLLANYGIENETFHYDEDGNPVFEDFITNSPDGLSLTAQMTRYALIHGSFSGNYYWEREISPQMSEEALETAEIWDTHLDYQRTPTLNVAEEHQTEYSTIFNDINTMVEEYSVKFITGQLSIENDWAAFEQELQNMNVGQMIEWAQQAYDMYAARDITVGYTEAQLEEYGINDLK